MPTVWFISDSELEIGKTGASKPTGHNLHLSVWDVLTNFKCSEVNLYHG